jgi:phenylalanyl-tRNA synthetase alpha chain
VELTDLTRDLEALRDEALASITAAPDVAALEAIEVDVLGKKGRLTAVLRGIGGLPAEDRPRVGAIAVMIDANDTASSAEAMIGDLMFERATQKE